MLCSTARQRLVGLDHELSHPSLEMDVIQDPRHRPGCGSSLFRRFGAHLLSQADDLGHLLAEIDAALRRLRLTHHAHHSDVGRPQTKSTVFRIRLGAAALAAAGVLFVLYAAIRPFSDEATLQGAAAFASAAWVVAHMLAMIGFTLLMLGLLALYLTLQDTTVDHAAFWALVVGLVGVGLTLPFYGGEAFGLHAIGQLALFSRNQSLMKAVEVVRSGPQLAMFLIGLLAIGVSAITVATAVWRSRVFPKWSGVPFALGFALYIPQFFGTQPVRVAHGLLVMAGCVWLAADLWQRARA